MDPTRRSEGSVHLAAKVKLRSREGVEVEADVKAVMANSRVLRDLIRDVGTDSTIPVPNLSLSQLKHITSWCQLYYAYGVETDIPEGPDDATDGWVLRRTNHNNVFYEDRQRVRDDQFHVESNDQETQVYKIDVELNDQEALDLERFHWEIFTTKFVNMNCSKFDWETIKGLHEAANYLDIPSLLRITSVLIKEAPSRAFMGVVSPWLDYDTVEAYRNHEMAVC